MSEIPLEETPVSPKFRTLSGRAVVIGLLVFGVLMVGLMGLYWEMYTRPFRPLQEAIHAEFPDSSPRVIGGQHKSHKDETPTILRIVIHVGFDPNAADEAKLDRHVSRIRDLAAKHVDLSPYGELEIHLVHRVPEDDVQQRKFQFPLSE